MYGGRFSGKDSPVSQQFPVARVIGACVNSSNVLGNWPRAG